MSKIELLKRNKNFRLLWLGRIVSSLGSNFHSIAVMWYVLQTTGSTVQMGISLIITQLPYIILGLISGTIADRYDKKKIIVISDVVNGLLVGVISVLLYTDSLTITRLYSISFVMSCSGAFFGPSVTSLTPIIVKKDDLIEANSLMSVGVKVCSIVGPALAGILFSIVGFTGMFLIDSISYILSGISEIFIKVEKIRINKNDVKKKNFFDDMKIGYQYMFKNKLVLKYTIVGGLIINLFSAPLSIYIPVFSDRVLNNQAGYGILLTSLSIGSVLAAMLASTITKRVDYFKATAIGFVGEGIFMLLFGISPNMISTIIVFILLGASFGLCGVCLSTVYQRIVPSDYLGRVSSVSMLLCSITTPIGYFAGGLAVKYLSLKIILITSGIIVTISGLTTIRAKEENNKLHQNC
ncbi:MFS transporter [Clostridiaceae bacterium M8S5]|nr:MFS transporter [Clostridiaceae bacterium M8S5]